MKLLIVSCLLIALSSAQTVYTVGTINLYPNPTSEIFTDPSEHNEGKNVSEKKREGVWQVACTVQADCETNDLDRGPSGFYCDDGVCVLCPINGCEGNTDPFMTDEEACKDNCDVWLTSGIECSGSTVQDVCGHGLDSPGVDTTGGNDGWFCNMKEIVNGNPKGICTRCSYVNTDVKGQKDQCFNIDWAQPNTLVSCAATCQMYEREQVEATTVDESQLASGLSALEENYGTVSLNGPFCSRFDGEGKGWCEEGSGYDHDPSKSSDLESILKPFDEEISHCQYRKCGDGVSPFAGGPDGFEPENQCIILFETDGTDCVTRKVTEDGGEVEVAGTCLDGLCMVVESSECPEGYATTVYDFPDCTRTDFGTSSAAGSDSNFQGTLCAVTENKCQGFPQQANNVLCTTESEWGGILSEANDFANPAYFNTEDQSNAKVFFTTVSNQEQKGTCVVGNADTGYDCIIKQPGNYIYRMMEIHYYEQDPYTYGEQNTNTQATILYIKTSTRSLAQTLSCPGDLLGEPPNQVQKRCFGSLNCEYYTTENGGFPCGGSYDICHKTTATPTQSPIATSHGDPIIWTFHDECYDLNMDGKYVASANPKYDHQVNIVVYNDYMREIEVVNKKGKVILSINVDGEYEADDYPYAFEVFEKECPADMKKSECLDSYMSFRFDAQEFQYFVHILRHDYADPSLKEGELGYHLDIYPTPYDRFYQKGHKEAYTGLYFNNPLPEELEYCPGGADRRPRD